MKVIKSYSNIWKTEKVIYALQDITLPRPVSLSSIIWFFLFFLVSLFLKGIPPFIFKNSILMNHVAIPAFFAWLMGKQVFDGKKPYSFVKSYFMYLVRPKIYVRGKSIVMENGKYTDICIPIGNKKVEKGCEVIGSADEENKLSGEVS